MNTRNRLILLALVFIIALAFLSPTLLKVAGKNPEDFGLTFAKPINLGLDLVGGVHLVYQVESAEAVKSRLQSIGTSLVAELRKQKISALRAGVNSLTQLEITLLGGHLVDRAKEKISSEYPNLQFVNTVAEGGKAKVIYGVSEREVLQIEKEAVSQAIETLRNRVDQFGVSNPIIQRAGDDRIILQMPGVTDIDSVKSVVGSVAKLEFRLLPRGSGESTESIILKDRHNQPISVESDIQMTGDAVSDARVSFDQGQIEISLSFTAAGAKTFKDVTTAGVGRQLAIVLDNVVYSSPRINEPIPGGRASITGQFSREEARQLAIVLRAGALPAPLNILEERTVGPTLGRESINNGILAMLAGCTLIFFFMIVYYRKSGWIAVAALGLNLTLMLSALAMFGAVLTLPGMAGLALTIGMAVDANVIIYERIREELRLGKSRDSAVTAGFERALSAIIDSNITTLISGLVLYYFGTGPIRGFAVALNIGIITTVFCATFASRLAFSVLPLRSARTELSI